MVRKPPKRQIASGAAALGSYVTIYCNQNNDPKNKGNLPALLGENISYPPQKVVSSTVIFQV